MESVWTTISLVVLVILLQAWLTKKRKKLPPGPIAVPILGHLHKLGKNPHQDLYQQAKKHGPIMYMRFGFVPNIIVSSAQAAEQFLKTYDLVFASRPSLEAAKYMSYDQKILSFSPYGSYWRSMRKLCTLELLSSHKINSFQPMRREELSLFINSIKQSAEDRAAVDLTTKILSLTADMTCRMVFGKKYLGAEFGEGGFKPVLQEGMHLMATPNLADYFPYIGVLDLQGLNRRMEKIAKIYDDFFEMIINDHVQTSDKGPINDFVDIMMDLMKSGDTEVKLDRGHVKATLMDMMNASMDTSASTIDWVFAELLKHPRALKKVQEEIKGVVGMDRTVEESDLVQLEYLDMVVKEALRLHPVAPLLLPHQATEDCTVEGFHIPKKSRVIINVWAIGRDPDAWTVPENFIPERFIGANIDVKGQNFELLPFGSGRRGCPGMQLGLILVRLVVANLAHCFDWELPDGMSPSDLNMTETFGLVMSRAEHLMAIPTYRLHK